MPIKSVGYLLKRENAYVAFLFFTVLIGFFNSRLSAPKQKQTFLTLLGVFSTFVLCGQDFIFSFITVTLGTLLIKNLGGSNHPRIVFVFSFLCRFIFSGAYYLGLPRNENNLANGIQLILTLKLISVAYEIKEYRTSKHSATNDMLSVAEENKTKRGRHRSMKLLEEPAHIDIFCYLYCVIGITTGPFFTFRTYYDMLNIPPNVSRMVPATSHVKNKLMEVGIYIIGSLIIGNFIFPNDILRSDAFYCNTSTIYRLVIIVIPGFNLLMKFSIAWGIAECAFVLARLGVYPASLKPTPGNGPTAFDIDIVWKKDDEKSLANADSWSFKAVENINLVKAFTCLTYAECFSHWNTSVQWWLARYVYSSPLLPRSIKPLRWLAVSTVCATWHGFKAAYYFAFLCLPLIVFAEESGQRIIGNNLTGVLRRIYVFVNWYIFKTTGMATFMTCYLLMNYNDIMRYLTSVYFFIYVVSVVFILLSLVIEQIRFSKSPKLFEVREVKSNKND